MDGCLTSDEATNEDPNGMNPRREGEIDGNRARVMERNRIQSIWSAQLNSPNLPTPGEERRDPILLLRGCPAGGNYGEFWSATRRSKFMRMAIVNGLLFGRPLTVLLLLLQ